MGHMGNSLKLRNITPEDESMLIGIGITSREQFERLGADKTYLLLQETGRELDVDLLYRLRGAERDIDWRILAERDNKHASSLFTEIDEP